MLGRFVVTGAEQFIRTKFSPPASSQNNASQNNASQNNASQNSEVSEYTPQSFVAEEQVAKERPPATVPLDDYDLLTSAQVVELLTTMSPDDRRYVWEYENTHRRRRTVLESSRLLDGS
jgi:hypothetical protein